MNKKEIWTFLLTNLALALTATYAHGGAVDIGGGGDTVYCKPSTNSSKYFGYYPLDYVVISSDPAAARELRDTSDGLQMNRIENSLSYLSPLMAMSLRQFRDLYLNTNMTKPLVWKQAVYGLVPLDDEELIGLLPENCYEKGANGKLNIIQTVIREERPGTVIFNYDPKIFAELTSRDNPYRSYILIHEWLRNFTKSARVIRDINRLLHSKTLDQIPSGEFEQIVENLGIHLSGQDDICARSLTISEWDSSGKLFVPDPAPFFPASKYVLYFKNKTPNDVSMYTFQPGEVGKYIGFIPANTLSGKPFEVEVPGGLALKAKNFETSVHLNLKD